MKKIKTFFLATIFISLFSCTSSEDDCLKTIIIQPGFTINSPTGSTIIPKVTEEVSCDFPEPEEVKVITELPKLSEFSYEILDLVVIPDTGNNTSKVSYSIKLNNLSNKNIKGLPYLTTRVNNDSFTVSYAFTGGCQQLEPNSSCIISFESEESLDIVKITSFSILNVEYIIVK